MGDDTYVIDFSDDELTTLNKEGRTERRSRKKACRFIDPATSIVRSPFTEA